MQRLKGKHFLHWRNRRLNFLAGAGVCIFLLHFAVARVQAVTFTASLDNDTLAVGQSTTLSLTFEGGQPRNTPEIPDIPGLEIAYVGPSSQFSFVNGQVSSTVTHHFTITPQKTGDFVIPAITATVDGVQLTSQPLQLKVVQPSAASGVQISSGSQVAFMKLSLPHNKLYIGENLVANLEICLRDDVRNYGNFQFTATPTEGFTIGKMREGQARREQIGNHIYTVVPVAMALTATRSGNLSLGPLTANVTLVIASSDQPNDPFQQFRQFGFGGFGDEQKQVAIATESVNVQALPLPTENVPPSFNGAIGEYTMTVTAGPTNVAVGDPVTVHIEISGRGDIGSLTLPNQPAWHDFTTYPPTSRLAVADPLGLQGTKSFEEIITPQNTDIHEVPPFSFSYFDPDTGEYRTLTEPSVALAVHSAGPSAMPTIAASQSANSQNPPSPEDILPIKDNLGALAQVSPTLITRPAFVALQSLPVLAFLAALVWRRRTDRLANNPRLRRQRAVAALMAGGIADLKRYAAENKPDEFFATLFRLLQEQLGERLDCPASSITENVVEENSILRLAPASLRDALREQFQLCNQARYAPVRGTAELNSVAEQFEKAIRDLQELKA